MARPVDRLSLGGIVRETIGIWRRDLWSLSILAVLIEVPLVLAEVVLEIDADLRDVVDPSGVSGAVLFVVVYGALTHHLMAGLLEGVVAEDRHGHPRPRLGEVLRGLPWVRLIVADLILTVVVFLGLLAFVVPGLIVLTWFSIVAPVINLERQPVAASFRRSFGLVRGHDLPVAVVALTTFAVPEVIIGVVAATAHTGNVVFDAVVHAVPAVVLLPLAALPLVVMTFDLVALDHRRT